MKLQNFNVSVLLVAGLAAIPAQGFVTKPSCRHNGAQPVVSSLNLPSVDILPRFNLVRMQAVAVKTSEPSSPFTRLERKRRLATGMAFLTGIADLALFSKYKSFATMMTGNTMWMALALMEQRFMDVGYYASVILSYLTGVSIFRRSDLALKKKTLPLAAILVGGLFVGSDIVFNIYQHRWIPMMMLAMGFGISNSVGQEAAGTLTFVITGHMSRLVNQIVDRVSRTAGRSKLTLKDKQAFVQNASVIGGFFAGAFVAGILKAKGLLVEKVGIFSAIGLSYAALFLWKYMGSLGGASWKRKDGVMCDVDDDGEVCDDDQFDDGTNTLEAS